MTAWMVVTVVWKSWTSAPIETFITDWSSTMRNCAVAKATSASQPLLAVALFTFPLAARPWPVATESPFAIWRSFPISPARTRRVRHHVALGELDV